MRGEGKVTVSKRIRTRGGLIGSVLVALLACTGGGGDEPTVLGIGSGSSLGGYAATARAIARVVNPGEADQGFRLSSVETAGSVANVEGVLSGELAFGLAQADVVLQAVNGEGPWQEKGAQRELRSLFTLYTEVVTIVAARDAGIRTTRDLVGKRVDIGHPDSGAHRNAVDVLDALGIDWRGELVVYEQKTDDRVTMYLDNALDGFFHTVGHPTNDILFAVNSRSGARLVAIEGVDALLAKHPEYVRVTLPPDLYAGLANEEAVVTVGVPVVLVTSTSLPDETVHALTRSVFDRLAALGEHDALLQGLDRGRMARGTNAPLHPGAERYLREAGLLGGL